jgi:hypothetical protein
MTVGYSGTPLVNKIGIKEGFLVLVVHPPLNYLTLLDPLPADVRFVGLPDYPPGTPEELSRGFDLIHLFTNDRAELFNELSESKRRLKKNGSIWVSWYKRAAKLPTEITEDTIRDVALQLGLVDVKVCAVDEKWSGLKLVIRRENRV